MPTTSGSRREARRYKNRALRRGLYVVNYVLSGKDLRCMCMLTCGMLLGRSQPQRQLSLLMVMD